MDKSKRSNKRGIKKSRHLPQLLLLVLLIVNGAIISQRALGELSVTVPITERTSSLVYQGRYLENFLGEGLILVPPNIAIVRGTGGISFLNISELTNPSFVDQGQGIIDYLPDKMFFRDNLLFTVKDHYTYPDPHDFRIYNLFNLWQSQKIGGIDLFFG